MPTLPTCGAGRWRELKSTSGNSNNNNNHNNKQWHDGVAGGLVRICCNPPAQTCTSTKAQR